MSIAEGPAVLSSLTRDSSFGITAQLLAMVPFANILFEFTTTCGAALWAADLEQQETTAPGLRDQAKKAS